MTLLTVFMLAKLQGARITSRKIKEAFVSLKKVTKTKEIIFVKFFILA